MRNRLCVLLIGRGGGSRREQRPLPDYPHRLWLCRMIWFLPIFKVVVLEPTFRIKTPNCLCCSLHTLVTFAIRFAILTTSSHSWQDSKTLTSARPNSIVELIPQILAQTHKFELFTKSLPVFKKRQEREESQENVSDSHLQRLAFTIVAKFSHL